MNSPVTPYQLAEFGALLAEPARAAIVLALLDSRARPAGELASIAGVGAATASAHLRRLAEAGFLRVVAQGRRRYYRLADEEVAHWVETLALASPRRLRARMPSALDDQFARARTCYHHLAGHLGVALFERLRAVSGLVLDSDAVRLNRTGASLLHDAGLAFAGDAGALALRGRTCMDWTERRFHLSGPLGTELARGMIDRGWLRRRADSRALIVSAPGRKGLRALGVEL